MQAWLAAVLNLGRSTRPASICLRGPTTPVPKNLTPRLMPSDGWRKRVEQLGLGFQLHVREPEAPTLEVVVEGGVVGERCDG